MSFLPPWPAALWLSSESFYFHFLILCPADVWLSEMLCCPVRASSSSTLVSDCSNVSASSWWNLQLFECVWTWCSSTRSQWSCLVLPVFFFSLKDNSLFFPLEGFFKTVYSLRPRAGCCVKSVECTGNSHARPVGLGANPESESLHRKTTKWILKFSDWDFWWQASFTFN